MSRLGKYPVVIPKGVEASFKDKVFSTKGKLGTLTQEIKGNINIEIKDNNIIVKRGDDSKENKALHGLYRMLIQNMTVGVSEGYTKILELVGVGFNTTLKGKYLELNLGYSHLIYFQIPEECKCEVLIEKGQSPKIILKSHNKQLLGLVAAKIRELRKPEPYQGKGVKYSDEVIIKKAGKSAGK